MDQKYFEDARTMFMSDGWKAFQEEVNEAVESLTLDSAGTSDEFFTVKGRLSALRQIAGYENALLAAELQQEADDAEDI